MSNSPQPRGTTKACVLTIAALFLVLRFVWLPVHLAHEHHAHGLGERDPNVAGPSLVHDHGGEQHEHEDDRHTSADPASELIARKAAHGAEFVWFPVPGDAAAAVSPLLARTGPVRAGSVPRPLPPRSERARAPPAA